MSFRRIPYWRWTEKYKPLLNPFTTSAGCDGFLFDDFGDALTFAHTQDFHHVWTLTVTDLTRSTAWIINNGYRRVDRVGFLITGIPWDDKHHYHIKY